MLRAAAAIATVALGYAVLMLVAQDIPASNLAVLTALIGLISIAWVFLPERPRN